MYGLAVNLIMSVSGHSLIINEIIWGQLRGQKEKTKVLKNKKKKTFKLELSRRNNLFYPISQLFKSQSRGL